MADIFRRLLGKQFLITSFLGEKVQIVNYIKTGYDENKPILINNRFLHFTAHIYYRSIVVDLHALFGKASNSNKYSFYQIIKSSNAKLNSGANETVESWLKAHSGHIDVIRDLRHRQMAHYDFEQNEAITLDFNNLEVINDLYSLAKKIISYYGESVKEEENRISFGFERHSDKINSLQRLLNKATRP